MKMIYLCSILLSYSFIFVVKFGSVIALANSPEYLTLLFNYPVENWKSWNIDNGKTNSNEGTVKVTGISINGLEKTGLGEVFVRCNNKKYSTSDNSLKLTKISADESNENKKIINLRYCSSEDSSLVLLKARIIYYVLDDFVLFEQHFPQGLNRTSSGDANSIITSFPSFVDFSANRNSRIGYAHWVSWFYGANPVYNGRKVLVVI